MVMRQCVQCNSISNLIKLSKEQIFRERQVGTWLFCCCSSWDLVVRFTTPSLVYSLQTFRYSRPTSDKPTMVHTARISC